MLTVMQVKALVLLFLLNHATAQGPSCVTPDNKAGSCQAMANCPKVKGLLQEAIRTHDASLSDRLRLYISRCGSGATSSPIVCCPSSTSTDESHQTFSISSEIRVTMQSCGTAHLVDKIVDGQNAELFAWPWTVLLLGQDGNGRELWHCGGSLISTRYVISAAHCFQDPSVPGLKVLKVRVGEYDFDVDPDCIHDVCAQVVDLDLEKVVLHPNYNTGCRACNDLALIRLSKDVSFLAPQVTPICLPFNPEKDLGSSIPVLQDSGKRAVISGWGSTSRDPFNAQLPSIMQQASVPLVQTTFCRSYRQNMTELWSIICAGGEGPDSCRGDSGGPLALNGQGEKWYLLGVISKGLKICGTPNTQTFYMNVHHYLSWILDNMHI